MPRKARRTKRKASKAVTEDSKKTVASAVEAAGVETLETYLTDFDIQSQSLNTHTHTHFMHAFDNSMHYFHILSTTSHRSRDIHDAS